MTKFRIAARHCCFILSRSASHGSGSTDSLVLKSSLVPSGRVMLVTGLPVAFSACLIILLMLVRRGLRVGLAGVRRLSAAGGGDTVAGGRSPGLGRRGHDAFASHALNLSARNTSGDSVILGDRVTCALRWRVI